MVPTTVIPKSPPSTSTYASFLDLPNEILFLIFSQPGFTTELHHLAKCSRRLNRIALRIFFAIHGISDPSAYTRLVFLKPSVSRGYRFDVMSALQINVSLTSIEKLSCAFPPAPYPPYYPVKELRRFTQLIERLERVGEVILVLDGRDRYKGIAGDDTLLRQWSEVFGRLLNLLIEKSCTSLTMQNGNLLTHAYELHNSQAPDGIYNNSVPHSPRSSLCNFMGDDLSDTDVALTTYNWGFQRPLESGKEGILIRMTPLARQVSNLRQLSVHSPILLLPPCFNWTLSVFQCSPLTCLKLSHVILTKAAWTTTLPCVAQALSGQLMELVIFECPSIPLEAVLEFLAELPLLQMLTLDRTLPFVQHALLYTLAIPSLQHLTALHAPSDYISHFLGQRPTSGRLPLDTYPLQNLQTVCIEPRQPMCTNFSIVDSIKTLEPILRSLPQCQNVALNVHMDLPCTLGMVKDIEIIRRLLKEKERGDSIRSPSHSRSASMTEQHTDPSDSNFLLGFERQWRRLDNVDLDVIAAVYGRVESLTLDDFCVRYDSPEILCRWLALFGRLSCVTLSWPLTWTVADSEGIRAPGGLEDIVKGAGGGNLRECIEELLVRMKEDCPSVKRIVLDQQAFDL
ncbi:hypothetical protein BDN72DRAFT_957452 [Pluteus cervinus]|uniref:Uncharacterized protein n=1 Tax=Pluteus cervinus TaxID=181527 RepID=A0ACD3B1Z4_9AGAR|nr:hypothetical protein BDN72DRAFT_957452 [Pluteus cervinus]